MDRHMVLNLPPYDVEMANRFIDVLTGGTDEPVTFQFFSDKDKNNRMAAIHRTMKRPVTYDFLQKKQIGGCGVYIMVNKGDGKGRAASNVHTVRALFIDLDGSPWKTAADMLKPHIMVESSPGRYHLYWLVSDCALDQFKPLQQIIAKKFDGDKSCSDLPRILRVPGFYHLKKQPFLTRLVEANDFPEYTVQQIVAGLGLAIDEPAAISPYKVPPRPPQAPPASTEHEYVDGHGEVVDLTIWATRNPQFDIVGSIKKEFMRGKIKDGRQHIVCPFADEHTESNPDLATYIANARLPEYHAFDVHCMHAHCADRDRLSFIAAMLDKGMLADDILHTAAAQMKKPPYSNYPAKEIAEVLQLRTLKPDEFRIVLHVMHLSFLQDDGTLPDNDWMLARSLGLDGRDWQAYLETLMKTGWLTIEDDRLFSPIFRREFTKAQNALMNKVKGGSTGGKKAAASKQAYLKDTNSIPQKDVQAYVKPFQADVDVDSDVDVDAEIKPPGYKS